VRGNTEAAAELMASHSRKQLSADKITGLITSSRSSLGVSMLAQERQLLKELAAQTLELWREVERVDKQITELVQANNETSALAGTVGAVTAAVLVAMIGPARSYPSAGAYLKALGLNLAEHSSGESKKAGTGLHITKKGPGLPRKYLCLAALRLIQVHPLMRRWYEARGAYKGGRKTRMKAVVALMRKLARGIWHVGQGRAFEVNKLFDARRLEQHELAVVNS
jgi:transposase